MGEFTEINSRAYAKRNRVFLEKLGFFALFLNMSHKLNIGEIFK